MQSDEEELSEDEEGDVEGEDEEDEAGDAEGDEESDDDEYQRDLAALVAIEAAKMKKVENEKRAGVYDDVRASASSPAGGAAYCRVRCAGGT